MKFIIAWTSFVVFAALTFIFFFQEGHGNGINTVFFTYKNVLWPVCAVLALISLYFVRKTSN